MISKKQELFDQIQFIIKFFRDYLIAIIIAILCLVGIGVAYTIYEVPSVYYSSAKIYIRPYTGGQNYLSESSLVSGDLAENCVEIAQSTSVLEKAIFNCRLQDMFSVQSLQEQMYAYADYQGRLVTILVADVDPARAQDLADAVCESTVERLNGIMDGEWAVIADAAYLPQRPEYPVFWKTFFQTIALGFSVIFFVAVLYSMQEHKISTADEVKKYLGLEILGTIPENDS